MLGISRKRFIKDLSKNNDSKERLGGTISSSLYAMMQGVRILRVHDANEINQSIKVFKALKFTMSKKYFGTDGIRGEVNKGNIMEKCFKFGFHRNLF